MSSFHRIISSSANAGLSTGPGDRCESAPVLPKHTPPGDEQAALRSERDVENKICTNEATLGFPYAPGASPPKTHSARRPTSRPRSERDGENKICTSEATLGFPYAPGASPHKTHSAGRRTSRPRSERDVENKICTSEATLGFPYAPGAPRSPQGALTYVRGSVAQAANLN